MCSVLSCNKDNPPEVGYASADFSLKASEFRQSHTFEWDVLPSGQVSIDPAEQKLQELWITYWNTVTVLAIAKDSQFEGVNDSSSDPKKVKVNKVDDSTCTLEWVGDTAEGEAVTITASAGSYTHTLKVYAKEVITLEGVLFDVNGRQYFSQIIPGEWKYDGYSIDDMNRYNKDNTTYFDTEAEYDAFMPAVVTVLDLEPENASFRLVKNYTITEGYIFPETNALPKSNIGDYVGGCTKDFSEFKGRQASWPPRTKYAGVQDIRFAFSFNAKDEKETGQKRGTMFHFGFAINK